MPPLPPPVETDFAISGVGRRCSGDEELLGDITQIRHVIRAEQQVGLTRYSGHDRFRHLPALFIATLFPCLIGSPPRYHDEFYAGRAVNPSAATANLQTASAADAAASAWPSRARV